jgi:hypothetical protein
MLDPKVAELTDRLIQTQYAERRPIREGMAEVTCQRMVGVGQDIRRQLH